MSYKMATSRLESKRVHEIGPGKTNLGDVRIGDVLLVQVPNMDEQVEEFVRRIVNEDYIETSRRKLFFPAEGIELVLRHIDTGNATKHTDILGHNMAYEIFKSGSENYNLLYKEREEAGLE